MRQLFIFRSLMSCADSNCTICSDTAICTECKDINFQIVSGVCVSNDTCEIILNCGVCDVTNPAVCQTCSDGSAFPTSKAECPVHTCTDAKCKLCEVPATCTACLGAFTAVSGSCVSNTACKSDANCATYNITDPSNCETCTGEFVPVNGACVSKTACITNDENCSTCDLTKPDICTKCNDNTVPTGEEKCPVPASPPCTLEGCNICADPQICTKCSSDYTLVSQACVKNDACKSADQNCVDCGKADPSICNQCIEGSKPNLGETCSPISSGCAAEVKNCQKCDEKDNKKCDKCDELYAVSGGKCGPAECMTVKDGKCDVCYVGFFKNESGLCQGCKDNCLDCTGAGDCTRCVNNFYAADNKCEVAKASGGVIAGVAIATCVALGAGLFMTWREIRKNKKAAIATANLRAGSLALD